MRSALELLGLVPRRRDAIAAEIETTRGSIARVAAKIAELQAEQRALLTPSISDETARERLDALTALVRNERDVGALMTEQLGRLEAEQRALDADAARAAARALHARAAAAGEAVAETVADYESLVAALVACEARMDAAADAFRVSAPPATQRYPGHALSNLRERRGRYLELQRAIALAGVDNVLGEPQYKSAGGLSLFERRLIAEAMPPVLPDGAAAGAAEQPPPAAA